VPNIVELILAWPQAKAGFQINVLAGHLAGHLNRVVGEREIQNALAQLEARELITTERDQYWLTEPDRPERDLYAPLIEALTSEGLLTVLGVIPHPHVFQLTATGGIRGDGRLSMPDFTLAVIKSWRFDPRSSLEVYSFEVKRRGGTSLTSVYEAVAHGRFAHHPYLVCPRSHLDTRQNADLQTACAREGVGLILFDIVVDQTPRFRVDHVEMVEEAERHSPDPRLVEQYLAKRLGVENCAKLQGLAQGGRT
jgi:hypothetical protein